ncbi:CHAT domain-containing protein [Lactarius akahatsu]|uniref:CHAT domain-containing protein n=1 Tax=Lactarius akahatsu TaxID=416441 RepID=A0AAD4LH28_9AGAM|nr:CHAT domain-containing protein [Lactarius akahatsu]
MTVPRLSIREIDSAITQYNLFLSQSHPSHPLRPACVYALAKARLGRYEQSNQEESDVSDLDNLKAILSLFESILLRPRSLPEPQHIDEFFSALTFALIKRSKKHPEHVIYAAKYLRHLRNQPHAASGFSRHVVTTSLVNMLVIQLMSETETSNVLQNTEEVAVICHELLISDPSDDDTTTSLTLLSNIVSSKILPLIPDQQFDRRLDRVIECLRLAKIHKPELRRAHFALAHCLCARYSTTLVNDDYEEITSILDEIIASSPPGDSQDEDIATEAQEIVTVIARFRSSAHKSPEYMEEAIYRDRAFRRSFPAEHLLNSNIAGRMEDFEKQRFSNFGSTEAFEASSSNSPLSQPKPVTFHNPEFVRMGKKGELLEGLLSGIRNGDVVKIDEAVEKGRSILASFAPTHPLASTLFELFGRVLDEAFKRTHKVQYLDESISTRRQVLGRPSQPSREERFSTLLKLSTCLLARCRVTSSPSHRIQDIVEALKLFSRCAKDETATLPDRCQCACLWAYFARASRHSSVSTAYENAMSLMQDALHFAPTLQLQAAAFSEASTFSSVVFNSAPLDYASYQVDLHQHGKAIETLERGRALLWSEMRRLRTSVDQLLQADPDLGNTFAAVNRDLEELTKSIPPSRNLNIDDSGADDLRAADPFGRLLLKQRMLVKERNNLISQIRTLPGFGSFLTSASFDTLRSAASSGPVIIINHSAWRSDILILLHNAPPSLIPTSDDFYNRTTELKDRLSESRNKYGLDSSHYDKFLASVLVELYKLVGEPVINRLRRLKVPEQSRIWWCPTSAFCSLPLHAMGPIPSDDGETRYFLDLYICSYTPTLSALIQSRNCDSGSRSLDRPSILLVAQPDPSLPTVEGEIQVIQRLDTNVTSLISEAATPTATIDGFQHHRFVHVACHGTLEARKPFDAGFELYGNERLTLLEIVRSHLPTAEFAFLSACHTAEATEGSVKDEVLHLVAAVQFCGFRSVVGTMWAMADMDGQDLAKHFYKSMFPKREKGEQVPYYKRSAGALHDAVKKLRRKRGVTLERWVNFVHYGA